MANRWMFIIICLAAAFNVNAQTQQELTLNDFYKEYRISQLTRDMPDRTDAIAGSPYEQVEFEEGKVYTITSQVYAGVPLRFNIHADEMEFTTEDGSVLSMAHPEIIRKIEIGQKEYIYAPYTAGNRILRGFFRVPASGSASLLVKPKVAFRQAEPAQPYKEAQPPTYLRMGDDFYLRAGADAAVKISGKKEIMQVMRDKSTDIDTWLKRNRIKYNREEDLIKLVEFYNSSL